MLLALGVSHKTAPIEVREKLAFSQECIPEALKALVQTMGLEEIALLSTCNRTEFYCTTSLTDRFLQKKLLSWWQQYHRLAFDMDPYLYLHSEENAVKHLMRVACGLDSMVIGESQILGQLKTAFHTAIKTGVMGSQLSRLFQTSFSIAKKVRTTTKIACHPVSVAFSAVTLAKQIFSDFSKATVLLIGAGENTELLLQHLAAKQVKHLFIVNRTLGHAKSLADRFDAQAFSLDALGSCLAKADIIISSIACHAPIITKTQLEELLLQSKRRPRLMIDLGVPRNIEPQVGLNEDIYLYTVDDLQGIITQNLQQRMVAAQDAEQIILKASDNYMDWMLAQKRMQTVRALRMKAEKIKNTALMQSFKQLDKGDDPKTVLTQLAHQLTQKLLHEPTMGLRKLSCESSDEKIDIAKELFCLE